jgi:hypothetical protein
VSLHTTPAPKTELTRVVTGMFRRGRNASRMRELATT